jgi:6-pyruvoyl-tetrahydropterin synthase
VFSVTVRDHMMVAHSLRGDVFGPAQRLHGATYVVDATFRRRNLGADGIVVDIGRASEELLAQVIADRLAESVKGGALRDAARELESLSVTLHESHVAWASYERAL